MRPGEGILSLVTPPAAEIMSLDEAKAHLGLVGDASHDGEVIAAMLGARQLVEEWTGRALVTQTWDWFCPRFPGACGFQIPKPPLISVTHVKYWDDAALDAASAVYAAAYEAAAGDPSAQEAALAAFTIAKAAAEKTFNPAYYSFFAPSGPACTYGRIDLANGASWPSVRSRRDAVRIRFVAGYGNAAQVPDPFRSAAKLLLGDLFEHREAQFVGVSVAENMAVERLLSIFTMRTM